MSVPLEALASLEVRVAVLEILEGCLAVVEVRSQAQVKVVASVVVSPELVMRVSMRSLVELAWVGLVARTSGRALEGLVEVEPEVSEAVALVEVLELEVGVQVSAVAPVQVGLEAWEEEPRVEVPM
jgi:hypothetical protein